VTHIIVVGNEKGGAGKSTVAMHVSCALARMGHEVQTLDLDLRQRSLGRYLDNRASFLRESGLDLPSPASCAVPDVADSAPGEGATVAEGQLRAALAGIGETCGFVVIDCPGAHTQLAQAAHARADTLITPLNDSFVDFDLLARIGADGEKILGPSVYSEMVWAARQARAQAGRPAIDWIVVRNRLGSTAMINKMKMGKAVDRLAKRIGFRVAPGFSERVVFRELFPRGLTLLDLKDVGVSKLTISNVAARQELRDLLKALRLPGVTVTF
jgi:chromosome partitioning protein